MSESVNHPTHYNSHPSGVEAIVVCEHFPFNVGSALKYLWRAGLKGHELEDLQKAVWYVDRELCRPEHEFNSNLAGLTSQQSSPESNDPFISPADLLTAAQAIHRVLYVEEPASPLYRLLTALLVNDVERYQFFLQTTKNRLLKIIALDGTEGLKEVDAKKLQEFQKLMTEEVIPKIVEAVEERLSPHDSTDKSL